MRKWGLVVTLFYGLLVLGLFTPVTLFLFSTSAPSASDLKGACTDLLPGRVPVSSCWAKAFSSG